MNKIWLIMHKEWLEIRQQPLLLGGMALLPLIFALTTALSIGNPPSSGLKGLPAIDLSADPQLAGLTQTQIYTLVTGLQFRMFYLLMPLLISAVIPAYSIVGEKTSRTLEPLLATPVRTGQLLLGKTLIALVLSTAFSWLGGLLFAAEFALFTPAITFTLVCTAGWWTALILVVPAMALIPIAITVFISSRLNDPRTAQQFSSVIALVMGAGLYYVMALAITSPLLSVLATLLLLAVGALSLRVATGLFQREVILTHWS